MRLGPISRQRCSSIIRKGGVFSGGKRHYGLVAPYLPEGAQWIDITAPLDAVFKQYHDEVIVFASGDPLFFGFANTIKRKMPDAEITLFPSFNSSADAGPSPGDALSRHAHRVAHRPPVA